MNQPQKPMSDEEQFKVLINYFQHEGALFWARSNYFMVANTIVIGFAFSMIEGLEPGVLSMQSFACFSLFIIGLVLLWLWRRANTAGEFWNYHWLKMLKKLEQSLFSDGNYPFTFSPDDTYPKREKAMKLPNHLVIVFLVAWLVLLGCLIWQVASY